METSAPHPFTWRTLRSLALASTLLLAATAALAQNADPSTWVPNGFVNTMLRSGNTLYLGGDFTYVGPGVISGGATLDPATGALAGTIPKVNGQVAVVVPDGSGGWYIGGTFTTVGDSARSNLARVLADGSVSAWNPNPDYDVTALALSGTTLYAGGDFSMIGGQPRGSLAAVSTVTGLATAWDPEADGTVQALLVHGSTVYAGGMFANVGGQARAYVAALDATTGNATAWDPEPDDQVYAFAASGSRLFVGGGFAQFDGQARKGLAAVDFASGSLTPWDAGGNGLIRAIVPHAGKLVVGGYFNYIGGSYVSNAAELDSVTAQAATWYPTPFGAVLSVAVIGSTVYLGGVFNATANAPLGNICAVDFTTGAVTTTWVTSADAPVEALATNGTALYAGGVFTQIGGMERNYAAAIDLTTGRATTWNPDILDGYGQVKALALQNGTVYAGGFFQHIGGQVRNYIAALDTVTGAATAWDPNSDHYVLALAVNGSKIIASGLFSNIGGGARAGLAAIDTSTALATPWNPGTTGGGVYAMTISGSTLYTGGTFATIGGQARAGLAAIDLTTGLTTGWNPNATGPLPYVLAVAVSGSRVYAGGEFTGIGGQPRNAIAALDATTGLATAWDPSATGIVAPAINAVLAIGLSGSNVYLGGQFTHVGGQPRNDLAVVDATSGLAGSWNPNADAAVFSILPNGPRVYAGGQFTNIGGLAKTNFASLGAAVTTGVASMVPAPARLQLALGPNPASQRVRVAFELPVASAVRLGLFDAAGRRVASLADGQPMPAGHHELALATSGLAPGAYFARLEASGRSATQRVVILR